MNYNIKKLNKPLLGKLSLAEILIDLFIFGLVISIVIYPTLGIVLDGWSFNTRHTPALILISIMLFMRFIVLWINQKSSLLKIWNKSIRPKTYHVMVAPNPAKTHKRNYTNYIYAVVLIIALIMPFFFSNYIIAIMSQSYIYILLGLGLNIVLGWAGLLHLGFVAFYAVGAYTLAMLYNYFGLGFWESLPIVMVISAVIAAILVFPVLRLYGDYLAIVTLGFSEIVRLLLINLSQWTGGASGMRAPAITFFGIPFSRREENSFNNLFGWDYSSSHRVIFIYIALLIFVCLTILIVNRLKSMPIGRSWESLRDNEIAFKSLGLSHARAKISSFAIGGSIAGLAGAFFATSQGFINPSSFTFIESAIIVSIVVLGGLGSIPGVIIAAIVLNWLPELLRDFANVRILIFGLAMVLIMLWRPHGLAKIVRPYFARNEEIKANKV